MSYKKGAPFCTSIWILERSQARIGLTMNFIVNSYVSIMSKNKVTEKAANRDRHVDFRVNDEEYAIGQKNAEACGLSVSEYGRKCFIGQKLKLHLTEREIEAYKSLSDARGDLVHIRSALKGKTQQQIRNYFDNDEFMTAWVKAINNIILQWDIIIEQLKE